MDEKMKILLIVDVRIIAKNMSKEAKNQTVLRMKIFAGMYVFNVKHSAG